MSLDDPNTAQAVRDSMRVVAQQVVDANALKPQVGRVISVDFVAMTATIWFPGDTAPVSVNLFSSVLPGTWQEKFGLGSGAGVVNNSLSGFGAMATVENLNGKRYITNILNGGQFSVDFEAAGQLPIVYDPTGDPGDVIGAEYYYEIIWDTFGQPPAVPALPNRGGPYAINIGPFLSAFQGQPNSGIYEVDLIGRTGLTRHYKFNFNPYYTLSDNNFGSIYDRWYRVIPDQEDEMDKSANSQRTVNNYTNLDGTASPQKGDWANGTNASTSFDAAHTNSGGGSLELHSTTGTQANVSSLTQTTARYACVPGATYQFKADALSTIAWASGVNVAIQWYNAAGTNFANSTGAVSGALTANVWLTTPTLNATAPAGAVTMQFQLTIAGTPAINQSYYWDNFVCQTQNPVTKTEFNLEVAMRQTLHGIPANDSDPTHSPGELWFRIYVDFLDAMQNPMWVMRVKNTYGSGCAKSLRTGKPVYVFDTAPIAAIGYLGYHDSNVGYTTNATQYTLGQFGNWSTGPWRHPDLTLAYRAQEVLSGGGTVTWNGSLLKWSAPFEIGGIGRSRNGLAIGVATIAMPTTGTIPIFPGGTQTAVLTGTGVPLAAGQALYFGIPPGLTSATIPNAAYFNGGLHGAGGLFIVDSSSPYWWSPPEWAVLIAYRSSDANQPEIKLGTGQFVDKWRALPLGSGWTNTAGGPTTSYRWAGNNRIEIVGSVDGNVTASTSTVGTMPAGAWRPISQMLLKFRNGSTGGVGTLRIGNDGTWQLFEQTTAGAVTTYQITPGTYPTDI